MNFKSFAVIPAATVVCFSHSQNLLSNPGFESVPILGAGQSDVGVGATKSIATDNSVPWYSTSISGIPSWLYGTPNNGGYASDHGITRPSDLVPAGDRVLFINNWGRTVSQKVGVFQPLTRYIFEVDSAVRLDNGSQARGGQVGLVAGEFQGSNPDVLTAGSSSLKSATPGTANWSGVTHVLSDRAWSRVLLTTTTLSGTMLGKPVTVYVRTRTSSQGPMLYDNASLATYDISSFSKLYNDFEFPAYVAGTNDIGFLTQLGGLITQGTNDGVSPLSGTQSHMIEKASGSSNFSYVDVYNEAWNDGITKYYCTAYLNYPLSSYHSSLPSIRLMSGVSPQIEAVMTMAIGPGLNVVDLYSTSDTTRLAPWTFTKNFWHRFDMLVDPIAKSITGYWNGRPFATLSLSLFSRLHDFRFGLFSSGAAVANSRMYWDNYSVGPQGASALLVCRPNLNDFSGIVEGIPVTIDIDNGTNSDTWSGLTDANGRVTVPLTIYGESAVSIKASHWLRRKVQGVMLSPVGVNSVSANLDNGDINGDNAVNLLDYDIFSEYFDHSSGDPDWDNVGPNGHKPSDADLNGDLGVNLLDYDIFSRNFDLEGD